MARNYDIKWNGDVVKGFSAALADASEHYTGWARVQMSDAVKEAISKIDASWPHTTITENTIRRTRRRGSMDWTLVTQQMFGGDRVHPWYSGQLHDSVVGVVSDKRKVISMHYMPSSASFPQKDDSGNTVNGSECAFASISAISRTLRFVPGVAASVFVTVPYAEKVNQMTRHKDFEQDLAEDFAASVEDYFFDRADVILRKKVYTTK